MKEIAQLADRFEQQLGKTAGRTNKKKMSRKQMLKQFDKAKANYQNERKRLKGLEGQLAALDQQIQDCRDGMRGSRSDMLTLTDVLRTMDLADCKHAVMYENDTKDVGYLIDGVEHHIKVNEDGELEVTTLKDHRKSKRQEAKEKDDENDAIPPSIAPAVDDEEEGEEEAQDVADADDMPFLNIEQPNFRFME